MKKHLKMKNSGILWVGEIPEHWEISRNKFVFYFSKSIVGDDSKNTDLLSMGKNGVNFRDKDGGYGKFPESFDSYQLVEPNDLIFCLFDIDETPRTIGHSKLSGMITSAYDVVKCFSNVDPRFIYYFYLHIDNEKKLRPFYTGLRKVVRSNTFLGLKIPIPPLSEQKQISKFLDIQMKKIEQEITKNQKLIQLIKEKKIAIINQTITKGLVSSVPMKYSGIKWIGDIPKKWKIEPLKFHISVNQKTIKSDFESSEKISYIDIGSVHEGGEMDAPEILKFSDAPSRAKRIVSENDTIISTVRTYLKSIAFIDKNHDGHICSTGFAVLTPKNDLTPKFLYRLISSQKYVDTIMANSFGIAYPAINSSFIGTIPCILPEKDEQEKITKFLDDEISKMESLILKIEFEIQKINELRQSLISSVVTGKNIVMETIT